MPLNHGYDAVKLPSAGHTERVAAAQRTRAQAQTQAEDAARGEFLTRLDNSALEVTDWEAEFLECFLQARDKRSWWTPGRRNSCDALKKFYHV